MSSHYENNAILSNKEYIGHEKKLAWRKLKSDLDKGHRTGEEKGWIPANKVRKHFEERYRDKN